MSNIIVYDKVSWHYPEGYNCPSQEAAKLHFLVIMKWLEENELLSDEGREIMGLGIEGDFSIVSPMLNKQGNEILKNHYSSWLKTIDYSETISLKVLNEGLTEYKKTAT